MITIAIAALIGVMGTMSTVIGNMDMNAFARSSDDDQVEEISCDY